MLKKYIASLSCLIAFSITSINSFASPMVEEPLYSYHLTNTSGTVNIMAMGIAGSAIPLFQNIDTERPDCHLESQNPLLKNTVDISNDAAGESTSMIIFPLEISATSVKMVVSLDYSNTVAGSPINVSDKCTIANTTTTRYTAKKVIEIPLNTTSPIKFDEKNVFYIKVEKSS